MIYVHPENVNDSLLAAIWVVEENILWEARTWRKLNWAKERREVISRLSLDLPTHLRILVINREFGLRQIIAPCMHGRAGFASKWNSFLLWFCFIFVHHVCLFSSAKAMCRKDDAQIILWRWIYIFQIHFGLYCHISGWLNL